MTQEQLTGCDLMALSESEARAKDVLETVLGRTFVDWDSEGRQGAVDLRSLIPPELSVEVKRWTCEPYQRGMHQWQAVKGWHPQSDMEHRWVLMVEIPTTGSANTRLPCFKTLLDEVQDLVRDMLKMEINNDLDLSSRRLEPAVGKMLQRWRRILPGGGSLRSGPVFSSAEAPAEQKLPGLEVAATSGSIGSPDPNSLADALNAWLTTTGPAKNLSSKLQASDDPHRHGFLVLDASHDSWWMLHHWGTETLPTSPLVLPEGIERIWVSGYGEIVWWFDHDSGWASTNIVPQKKIPGLGADA